MSYDIETIDPKDYTDLEIRDLMVAGLRAQHDDGSADDFIEHIDTDTDFYLSYMEDKLLVVMREGSPKRIVAYVLLLIVPLQERNQYILYVPGKGFAHIVQANITGDGPKELEPKEAMLELFNAAEKDVAALSKHEVEEGRAPIGSITILLSRTDWKIPLMGPGQFLSYEWSFILPYVKHEERYDMDKHPIKVSRVDANSLKLMHLNLDKDVIEKLAYTGNVSDMKYLVFDKDDFEALVTIYDEDTDPQIVDGIPTIEIERMTMKGYDFDQDNDVNKDPDFIPRTVACISQIGEYVCHTYGYTNLAIDYTGSETDAPILGQEYVTAILFVRSLNNMC